VLNLVLTFFCQDKDEAIRGLEALEKGKAKNNRILIMLIGQGRGGKTSLMRRLLGLALNSSAMPMPVALYRQTNNRIKERE
jgi:GTPase SAR1 family protein